MNTPISISIERNNHNPLVAAAVLLGADTFILCIVPWKGLKSVGLLAADSAFYFLSGQVN